MGSFAAQIYLLDHAQLVDAIALSGTSALELLDPRRVGFRDLSTHVYGGARHEVLNETNSDEVIANLIAWTNRVTR